MLRLRTFAVLVVFAAAMMAASPHVAAQLSPRETTWTMAAVGDAIINRPIMQFDNPGDPRFQGLAKVIRGADAALVNLEQSIFRFPEFKGWPEVENGGNWEVGPPEVLLDLKAMGFDLYNRANNHTTDYGVEGMRVTNALLDQLGLTHAGSGMSLGQASRPGYFESAKGRIALIGLASSFTPMSRAGDPRPDAPARPGLNALRVEQRYEADAETLASLRAIAAKFGSTPGTSEGPLRFLGVTIAPGRESRTISAVNQADEQRILRELRNASDQADFVIVTSHTHQSGRQGPPDWQIDFARKCIDAGAVTFVVHGPHLLRGIEIYKGRPIFYSVGNFVFQNETIDPMPSEHYEIYDLPDTALASDLYNARFKNGTIGFPASAVYYESVVAVPTFKGTTLIQLTLHPIDMGQKAPRSQRGTPRLADPATGRAIIERLAKLSAPFGTTIVYENGAGVWRAGQSTAAR